MPSVPETHLLVRTLFSAISVGTEIRMFRDEKVAQNPSTFPLASGYSAVGVVEQLGSAVDGVKVGDHVFLSRSHDEFHSIDASDVYPVRSGAPLDQAAFAMLCEVGLHALRRGAPSFGENVAVIGQGVIGLMTLSVAKAWGLRTIALDLDPTRLEMARRVGAGIAISPVAPGFEQEVQDYCRSEGVDLAIECASSWHAVKTAYQIVRRRGRIVVVARHTDVPNFNMIADDMMTKEITFTTSYAHPLTDVSSDVMRWTRPRNIRLILDAMSEGTLDVSSAISDRVSPEQIPEIYQRLDAGDSRIAGVSIDWR
ncbi:zinc-dependent alcohol dehydrogenase [Microbacterium saperdae]